MSRSTSCSRLPKGLSALSPNERIGLLRVQGRFRLVRRVRPDQREPGTGDAEQAQGQPGWTVESPYVVAVDPAGGNEELLDHRPPRKATRKKKSDESASGPERTLAAVLTEQLAAATANRAGKPPRWVSLGLGAFLASHVDSPSSPYYRRLRAETAESIRIGWQVKAKNEVLGAEASFETTRAHRLPRVLRVDRRRPFRRHTWPTSSGRCSKARPSSTTRSATAST